MQRPTTNPTLTITTTKSLIASGSKFGGTPTQPCPVCKAAVPASERYPHYVCPQCVERAVDRNGRRVGFANAISCGGVVGYYEESSETYLSLTCFIDGKACFAEEAKFGGIVIQPLPEHPLLKPVIYDSLNSRQQENYNYQKLAGVLADFGFITHRLSDDWNGADMIAQHINGDSFIKIQLKGRLTFSKKYEGKDADDCEWQRQKHGPLADRLLVRRLMVWILENEAHIFAGGT